MLREEMVEQDKEVPDDLRTMNLLKDIFNTITACVQYTVDCPSLHTDGRVPVLDLKVLIDDGKITRLLRKRTRVVEQKSRVLKNCVVISKL